MASELSFALKLIDGMSAPSKQASAGVEHLTKTLKDAKAALSTYQAQLSRAKQLGDVEGFRKYSGLVDVARRSVFDLTQQVEGLAPAATEGAGGLEAMAGAAGPYVSVALKAIAVTAGLAVGLGALTYEVIKFSLEATEARRQTEVLFDALGEGQTTGKQMIANFDDLSTRIGKTRAELTPWAKQLEAIGITDMTELRGQLVAVASAQALNTEGGAEAYENLTRKIHTFIETGQGLKLPVKGLGSLREVGLDVNDVAKEMGVSGKALGAQLKAGTVDAKAFGDALEVALVKKGKGPLKELSNTLPNVLKLGIEGFKKFFDSIDFEPLTNALRAFFGAFDSSDEAGKALKGGITGGINGIVTGLSDLTEEVEFFFLTLENYALRNKKALDTLWTIAKFEGRLFLAVIEKIAEVLSRSVGLALRLADALSADKGAHINTPEEVEALRAGREAGLASAPVVKRAPANDAGGIVMRPAAGEAFASVAPGERITPAGQSGGGGVHIERLELHIDAPAGVTDATSVSANALARALERYQLSVGR